MSVTAILLLIVSACTHAAWNLLGKRTPSAVSFFYASLFGVLVLAPFLFIFRASIPYFNALVWIYLGATGAFQALYYVCLAAAYRRSDMSLVYPVARSTPVVLVLFVSILVGRGSQISVYAFIGIFLIVTGGYFLPLERFTDTSVRKYVNAGMGFAALAAFGTAGYSTIDDAALRLVRDALPTEILSWQVSVVYAFFEGLSSAVWLLIYLAINAKERKSVNGRMRPDGRALRDSAKMGVGIYLTYSLVLVSMAFVRDVSYVVAFRQLSIPIGVVFSFFVLKEKLPAPKIVGTLLMFAGLVLVGTG